ncbi:competence/damage-inducible protein A [Micavibrio aeruginosavorus]|uniref:competence/damage-inducible protein A n=1 Tax=Micavibrio aeruginosavorus TaxID=349221 RepID=UPI003F4AD45A
MPQYENPDLYKAALVIIGNEILSGRTADANTPWIAERLTERGILLAEVRVIPDIEAKIINTVQQLSADYDYVFTTGGIGPTHDDITAESVAKAFDLPLERDDEAFAVLEEYYGLENLTPPRAKMSMVPKGSTLIPNPVSGAPGFITKNVHVMAGVPRIMQAMMDHVLDQIQAGKPLLSNTVTCSLPESKVAEELTALQNKYPDVDIGSYPHYRGGVLGLSLVMRATNSDSLDTVTQDIIALIRSHGDEPRALSVGSHGRNLDVV